jgi:imidazolonepropionase-like amidohydrolase
MKKANSLLLACGLLLFSKVALSQASFPENGVADPRHGQYAFTNATIVRDGITTLTNGTMIIKDGKIVAVGTNLKVPAGAVEVNCSGKYIYPSFIDIYADYGIPSPQRQQQGQGGFNFGQSQLESNVKGAYGWNQAIKSDVDAYKVFNVDEAKAKPLRDQGFGTVLSHVRDGIARGTGTLVTLANEKENMTIVRDRASSNYSFSKGTSTQSYPSSMMGSIALLRQTFLDAQWYSKYKPSTEGFNISLQSWTNNLGLPQIFEAGDKWNDLRADRIGDEFGVQYIIKAGQNEYQRIREMKATNATFILPLNFPQAQDVEDPNDARFVSLSDMKHWELAPTMPAAFEKAGIPFCLTTSDLRDVKSFLTSLRTSINYGLSENAAITALTKTPATALGVFDQVGSLDAGKWANFLITSGPIFNERTTILQNWVQGEKYGVKDDSWNDVRGTYKLVLNTANGPVNYVLNLKTTSSASLLNGKDTITPKFYFDGRQVRINVAPERRGTPGDNFRLSGIANEQGWSGLGEDSSGRSFTWTASFDQASIQKDSTRPRRPMGQLGKVTYPFEPFGWTEDQQPKQETILIKNATVWTNEKEGVLQNADVLIKNGKIAAVGKNLSDASAKIIDGTGKHVTPGIIDEHSHIAAASINEGGQSVSSEVRIGDNLNPEDINIYRQLSGGVTTSHILHGSANTIGGQCQVIKLRWGSDDDEIKFKGSAPTIKFALGENVKRSPAANGNNRYPDTRMGVNELLIDAFTRAKDYKKQWADYNNAKDKKGLTPPRRDLELDALVEILDNKRFITCHSYVQSEILGSIDVANKMGYHYNTFTHILEGYKVAKEMLAHGANASTFSDWWAYKMEVEDAIPYNAAIMQKVGLNVAINSDDAEMARRLNQEAGKIVKYGGVTEEQALKMVTLNPAKMLHIENKVGSLKVGKDGDVVVWTDNPLSIYAKSLYTIVDGTIYFDREKDQQMEKQIDTERNRLVKKMVGEKQRGMPVTQPVPSYQIMHSCFEHGHEHGLLVVDTDDVDGFNN